MRVQAAGWRDFQSCVPPLELGVERGAMGHAECRLSCASDPECYCYSHVSGVCYSGMSRAVCAEAYNESGCYEAGGDGFVVHKDMVRRALCWQLYVRGCAVAGLPCGFAASAGFLWLFVDVEYARRD